jgi:hypothetical protein
MRTGKSRLVSIGIIIGAFLAILLLFGSGYYLITRGGLNKKLDELRKAGEPLCLADLARKPIPADQNGAAYLLQAKEDTEAIVNEIYALDPSGEGKETPESIEKINAILAAHPKILPLMQKAVAAPEFQLSIDYSVKPSQFTMNCMTLTQSQRNAMRSLHEYLKDLLNHGKQEEARQTAMLMLRLARQLDRDCLTMMHFLVNSACHGIALDSAHNVLQAGPIDDQFRAELDAELARYDSLKDCRASMHGERAYCLDSIKEMPAYLISSQWQLYTLEYFEDFFKYSTQPYFTGVSKGFAQPSSMIGKIASGPVTLMLPALQAVLECAFRSQAMTRSLRIINALQKNSPADGKIPGMAELGLPADVGLDPFNGKPMIIKKLPEGWQVYSVGKNMKDDGGQFEQSLDHGFGPKVPKIETPEAVPEENFPGNIDMKSPQAETEEEEATPTKPAG